jgi:hypothetical protein
MKGGRLLIDHIRTFRLKLKNFGHVQQIFWRKLVATEITFLHYSLLQPIRVYD